MDRSPATIRAAFHTLGLWIFAVGYPLMDVLARNPEFFIAHNATPATLIAVVGLICFVPPLLFAGIGLLVRRLFPTAGSIYFPAVVGTLGFLSVLPALNRVDGLAGPAVLAIAAVAGVSFAVIYHRSRPVRSGITVLSVGACLAPLWFLLLTPIRSLAFPAEQTSVEAQVARQTPPIVFVIFDSLASIALLNEDHEIDAARFPNFADLARKTTWYRHTAAASNSTVEALPAILTGRKPVREKSLPTVQDHPRNLFTLLSPNYSLNVVEPHSSLCPEDLKNVLAEVEEPEHGVQSTLLDSAMVYLHMAVPSAFRGALPDVSHTWQGFTSPLTSANSSGDIPRSVDVRLLRARRFIRSLQKTSDPTLHFLHVALPHIYYDYLPTGQFYAPLGSLDGLVPAKPFRTGFDCDLAHQRYLLQVGLVDRLLGELIGRLKAVGVYEEAMIVITSDHGVSFRRDSPMRRLTDETYADVLAVPLFVKTPRQRAGKTVDDLAFSVDILPTIADVLGIQIPWSVDGISLDSAGAASRKAVGVVDTRTRTEVSYSAASVFAFPGLDEQLAKFGSGERLSGLALKNGPGDLLGRKTDEFRVASTDRLVFSVDQSLAYTKTIDTDAKFLPLYLSGRVQPRGYDSAFQQIAATVNGRIAATAPLEWSPDGRGEFRLVLPIDAIRDGRNQLEVYAVESPGGSSRRLVGGTQTATYQLTSGDEGEFSVVDGAGRNYRVTKEDVEAYIRAPKVEHGQFVLIGWAVQEKAGLTPSEVVLFADGHFLTRFPMNRPRREIAKRMGRQFLHSGFHSSVPVAAVIGRGIKAYALFENGLAGEMRFYYVPKVKADKRVLFTELLVFDRARLSDCGDASCVEMPYDISIATHARHGSGEFTLAERTGEYVHVTGWALGADKSPAKSVLVFANEKLAHTAYPRLRCPEARQAGARSPAPRCGFDFYVPLVEAQEDAPNLRLVAAADGESLWELPRQ